MLMRFLKGFGLLALLFPALDDAAASSISCQCRAAFVCDARGCRHFDTQAPDCFTFKLIFDRSDTKVQLCRDAVCDEARVSVARTDDGQVILSTSAKWGGTSGGPGTLIMVDRNTDFVYRQTYGYGLEVISGPCE